MSYSVPRQAVIGTVHSHDGTTLYVTIQSQDLGANVQGPIMYVSEPLNIGSEVLVVQDELGTWWVTSTGRDNSSPEGEGDKHYHHVQGTPTATWVINHGLGKVPSIEVINSGGDQVIGAETIVDLNTTHINFSGAFSGDAYCN